MASKEDRFSAHIDETWYQTIATPSDRSTVCHDLQQLIEAWPSLPSELE
jgi:hypothetical protein